jgi:purine-nucleoside phosphorylase
MRSYPDKQVLEATTFLKQHVPIIPEAGILTGSGLGGVVEEIEDSIVVRYSDIPHFPVSSVKGHAGEVVVGHISGKRIVALSGRVHYYEGHGFETIVFPIKIMASLGVKTVMVTNAAGGINETFLPGDIVSIIGHLDLMRGVFLMPAGEPPSPKKVYAPKLISQAKRAAEKIGVTLKAGIYAAVSGPCYETAAEIRALRIMGADMVGMSTVPEVIEANRLGMKVLGFSFITNPATGMSENPLSHQEVIETSARILPTFKALVKQIVSDLDSVA